MRKKRILSSAFPTKKQTLLLAQHYHRVGNKKQMWYYLVCWGFFEMWTVDGWLS